MNLDNTMLNKALNHQQIIHTLITQKCYKEFKYKKNIIPLKHFKTKKNINNYHFHTLVKKKIYTKFHARTELVEIDTVFI